MRFPTLFALPPSGLPLVDDACHWVTSGHGWVSQWYQGVRMRLDDDGRWWTWTTRSYGNTTPPEFVEFDSDMQGVHGWVPLPEIYWADAVGDAVRLRADAGLPVTPGVYFLRSLMPAVAGQALFPVEGPPIPDVPRDHAGICLWLGEHPEVEGLVWHNPDGRKAIFRREDVAEFHRTG